MQQVKVGDIYYDSWGYDQTNVDFYQVIKIISAHTVEIRELKHIRDEENSDCVLPAINDFYDEPIKKRICRDGNIKICSVIRLRPWKGQSLYRTY